MFSDRRHRCASYDIQPLFVSYHLTISLCNIRTSKQLSELLSSLLYQLSLLYWNQFLLPHMFIHIIFQARPCLQMQILNINGQKRNICVHIYATPHVYFHQKLHRWWCYLAAVSKFHLRRSGLLPYENKDGMCAALLSFSISLHLNVPFVKARHSTIQYPIWRVTKYVDIVHHCWEQALVCLSTSKHWNRSRLLLIH